METEPIRVRENWRLYLKPVTNGSNIVVVQHDSGLIARAEQRYRQFELTLRSSCCRVGIGYTVHLGAYTFCLNCGDRTPHKPGAFTHELTVSSVVLEPWWEPYCDPLSAVLRSHEMLTLVREAMHG